MAVGLVAKGEHSALRFHYQEPMVGWGWGGWGPHGEQWGWRGPISRSGQFGVSLLLRVSDTPEPSFGNQEPRGYFSLPAGTEESLGLDPAPLLKGPLCSVVT